jgi:lysophospholipase L1-like esterase
MFKNNARYVIVAAFLLMLNTISAIIVFYYISKINFYGELEIIIKENKLNSTSDFDCYGITYTGNKIKLPLTDSIFVNDGSYYFSEIEINNKSKKSSQCEIIIISQGREFTIEQVLDNQQSIRISQNPNCGNLLDKVTKSGLLQAEYTKIALFLIILLACIIVICSLIIVKKPIFLIILITSTIFFFILLLVELLIKSHPGIWTGVWLSLISFCILLFLMIQNIQNIKKQALTNILLTCASLVLTITIAGMYLRLTHKYYNYSELRFGYYLSVYNQKIVLKNRFYKPLSKHYLEGKEFKYERNTNSFGLSDEELIIAKKDKDYLIIGLGDSFTEGDGAHSDSTWLKFLERKMPDTDSVDFKWINGGLCGSDPFYSYKLLKDKLLVFNPDLVIINYGNELTDVVIRGGIERFDSGKIAIDNKIWEPLYAVSFVFRLFVHDICGYNDLLLTNQVYEKEKHRAIEQLKISLLDFKELSEEHGFQLLIVFHPMKREIDEKKYDNVNNCNYQLIEFAIANDINYVDLLQYYVEVEQISAKNSQNYYWVYDGHHNAAGYEKFANGVHWKLKQMGL